MVLAVAMVAELLSFLVVFSVELLAAVPVSLFRGLKKLHSSLVSGFRDYSF